MTEYDIAWDFKAVECLDEIAMFYSESINTGYGKKIKKEIVTEVDTLWNFPERYPKEHALIHLPENYRSMTILKGRFKVVYEVYRNTVFVLYIYSTKKDSSDISELFE